MEIRAIECALDENLRLFSLYLQQQGIRHKVIEDAGRQVVLVESAEAMSQVREIYQALQSGALKLQEAESPRPRPRAPTLSPWQTPLTLLLLVLGVAGFLLVQLDDRFTWVSQLTYFPFEVRGEHGYFYAMGAEYWRLITPIFLHFGLLHIVFNSLWLWELGRRVELQQGRWRLLGLVVLMGVGSNLAQALYSGPGIFGGLSGVIYGLLGYLWVWNRIRPTPLFHLSNGLMLFMVGWLLFCMTGFTSLLGVGDIANAAHLGGLVMGALLGLLGALILNPKT